MKQEALTSDVGKNWLPFEKKTRGKVWKPKAKKDVDDKNILPNELTDVLDNASEAELMEIAGILQYNVFETSALLYITIYCFYNNTMFFETNALLYITIHCFYNSTMFLKPVHCCI